MSRIDQALRRASLPASAQSTAPVRPANRRPRPHRSSDQPLEDYDPEDADGTVPSETPASLRPHQPIEVEQRRPARAPIGDERWDTQLRDDIERLRRRVHSAKSTR